MARKHKECHLRPEDRPALERLFRAHKTPQNLIFRARILTLCDAGHTAEEAAQTLNTSTNAVYRWLNRYQQSGHDGIKDLPRPGQPTKITKVKVEEVLRLSQQTVPRESTHWSLRLMAKRAGITVWQVQQIWNAAGLKPHVLKTFKISNDPAFAEKVIDVVGLYMNPPENAIIVCVCNNGRQICTHPLLCSHGFKVL